MSAVRALLAAGAPQAILLVGPASSGKTTLALDVAAALLCSAVPDARPCRACRGCRLVAAGRHPDAHRLAPGGAGRQIAIGDQHEAEPGTVRRLIVDLALTAAEGGARVAIVEEAERMNEHAQNALLKTLEEPPAGVTILICAEDEDRILPTVRSRCARVRLGPVGARDIESLLVDRGAADAPTAARLARLAAGRPGLALAYALAPEAVAARGELGRSLLDLLGATRTARLGRVREMLARSREMVAALAPPDDEAARSTGRGKRPKGRPRPAPAAPAPTVGEPADGAGGPSSEPDAGPEEGVAGGPAKLSAAERRRAALALLDVWRDLARDLIVAARGGRGRLRDPGLLDDLDTVAGRIDPAAGAAFLTRLERTARLIEGNAAPELALDVLVLAWSGDALAA